MKFFKRRKAKVKVETPAARIRGLPFEVYESPTGTMRKGTAARNVTRIGTLKGAMVKLEGRGRKDSPEYESLRTELTRRVKHFQRDYEGEEGK